MMTVQPPADLVEVVSSTVASQGGSWFPEWRDQRLQVRFHSGAARARCFLYRFEVGTAASTRLLLVKVRHSERGLRRLEQDDDRPVLAPVRTMTDEDEARREFEGLRLIAEALQDDDTDRFGIVRPLAWLPGHPAFITDIVTQPTLRAALLATSRLHLRRGEPLGPTPWENAGAWLRRFHDHQDVPDLPARCATADEVADLYHRYARFIAARSGGSRVLDEIGSRGAEITRRALPAELPLRTGHGDFVATNLFTSPEGRITGFDPLPVWRLPSFQDLATIVVGMRVLPVQAASQGLAFPAARLASYEAAVLRGYFGSEPVPLPAVQSFQLLVLLDRWAARVGLRSRRRGARRQLQEAGVRLASRHYEREARRLLGKLADHPVEGEERMA